MLYIYFKHDRQAIQTRPIILANLLSQLVQRRKQPSETILRFFDNYAYDRTLVPGPERTLSALRSEIATYIKAYIVVDAFDEFSQSNPVISGLTNDLESLKANLLITSRYDVSFVSKSSASPRIDVYAKDSDIQMFIDGRISTEVHLKEFVKKDLLLRQEILDSICTKSKGM